VEHIVITDGYTLNPGNLDWKPFGIFGQVDLYERTSPAELLTRSADATIIVTNKTPITAEQISGLPKLKMIAVTATGYNVIDVVAAKQRGIVVSNVPAYGTDSVAQHAFALMLELTNNVGINNKSVHDGEWFNAKDWCYSKKPIMELRNKVLGVVGFGSIGQQVAKIAVAFGMKVIYHNSSGKIYDFAISVSLEKLFRESDIISLHLPLKNDTHGFVNNKLLSLMKPSAFLINTSRGQLINENDLADVLKKKNIAGAGLDVLSTEPPPAGHPLVGLDNCIITPHNAWFSIEARQRIMSATLQNIASFVKGTPENVV